MLVWSHTSVVYSRKSVCARMVLRVTAHGPNVCAVRCARRSPYHDQRVAFCRAQEVKFEICHYSQRCQENPTLWQDIPVDPGSVFELNNAFPHQVCARGVRGMIKGC
eukprot:4460552-Pyramimonas_sp.AAC.1